MNVKSFFLYSLLFAGITYADSPFITTDGVGARSYGMGNNFTALSNDYSATFWNPAGLAFLPVREVHVAVGGSKLNGETTIGTSTTDSKKNDMYFSSLGLVRSIPTTRGGFAFAIGYSRPYSFNDINYFKGTDIYTGSEPDTGTEVVINNGDVVNFASSRNQASGHLNMWSVSAGWQVAERLGFGATLSLLNGKEKRSFSTLAYANGGFYSDGQKYSVSRDMVGVDIRIGGLYQLNRYFSVGSRIELPKTLHFRESSEGEEFTGVFQAPFSGSAGVATTLPFATVTADGYFRAPNPDADSGDLSYWKIGAGAGVEVPLRIINSIIRLGYSWQELDCYPYGTYLEDELQTDELAITSEMDRYLFTCGITVALNKSISLEGAYGLTMFAINTIDPNWKSPTKQSYSNQRGILTISVRY